MQVGSITVSPGWGGIIFFAVIFLLLLFGKSCFETITWSLTNVSEDPINAFLYISPILISAVVMVVSLKKSWSYWETVIYMLLWGLGIFTGLYVIALFTESGDVLGGIIGRVIGGAFIWFGYMACELAMTIVPAMILAGISVGIKKNQD